MKHKLNLSIINDIKEGLTLVQIAKKYKVSKSAVSQFLKPYKVIGAIKKIGYGVWDIDHNKLSNMPSVGKLRLHSDKVRGHGFQFILKIPELMNWNKREEYLTSKNILYKIIGANNWKGQSITLNNHKIWLLDKSIVVYFPSYKSYFSDTSKESKNYAIYDFLNIVNKLERLLKVSFRIYSNYNFRIGKQHYALIRNALAQQYDREGKKLNVRDADGEWLLIDNSFNLHELETVHPKTADIDNKIVLDFFNSLKQQPITSATIYDLFNKIGDIQLNDQQKWDFYAKHIESHTKSIIKLEKGINRLFKYLEEKNGN